MRVGCSGARGAVGSESESGCDGRNPQPLSPWTHTRIRSHRLPSAHHLSSTRPPRSVSEIDAQTRLDQADRGTLLRAPSSWALALALASACVS